VLVGLQEAQAGLPQGPDTPMTERGCKLSRGRLLLLDEPTSAMDPRLKLHVHGWLEHSLCGAAIVSAAA
jgi:hypothetical protein